MHAKKIIFIGKVQGVGFRFTAHNIANRYCLTGYVKNLPDGSVEILAQGPQEDIDSCIRDISESFQGYIRQTLIEDTTPNTSRRDFKISI